MHTPPFDSIRDYVAALAERKLLLQFNNVNQDAFEGTAIMYQLVKKHGLRMAPAVMLEDDSGQWTELSRAGAGQSARPCAD